MSNLTGLTAQAIALKKKLVEIVQANDSTGLTHYLTSLLPPAILKRKNLVRIVQANDATSGANLSGFTPQAISAHRNIVQAIQAGISAGTPPVTTYKLDFSQATNSGYLGAI